MVERADLTLGIGFSRSRGVGHWSSEERDRTEHNVINAYRQLVNAHTAAMGTNNLSIRRYFYSLMCPAYIFFITGIQKDNYISWMICFCL